ncbi:NLP/P60 [Nitrococcus mobilis Nb-231]|uniref:NLP/P60 n=2 Tax=Nitrococcus mobilis TaxID=35797 RepID=A4BN12_9GAMM|nr:NLP/P60 [Nitrococcus mobilis Nb-231]
MGNPAPRFTEHSRSGQPRTDTDGVNPTRQGPGDRLCRFEFVLAFAAALLLALAGCAELPEKRPAVAGSMPAGGGDIARALYTQLAEWRAVEYRYGGTSKRGADCSGFVYVTYLSRFGIHLPRSTERQARAGPRVSVNRLHPGDLVFFHTGWGKRHVGIYIEGGRFIHASTSSGVTMSRLDSGYWKSHFWKAVRVM